MLIPIIIYHVIFLFFTIFQRIGEPYHFIVIIPSKKSAKSIGNCQVLKY